MKKWSRYTMSALTVVVVLAISAMQVVPVLADGEVPPPPESTEVVPPPQEESTPDVPPLEATAEAPVVEETAAPPPAPTGEPVVSSEVPVAEIPAPEAETPAEVLAQLPEGTDLVVLDENGEALPLVSEEAAEVISNGDPQWCPVGVTPGSPSCSGTKDSFNGGNAATDLIQWLIENHPSVAGVIWVAYDYNSFGNAEGGTPIVLNGDSFATLDNFALTIKGGWSGVDLSTVINPLTPSVFTVPLQIINWTGAITISDIVISDVAAGTALEVETKGNISLTNVQVGTEGGSNTGPGAVLDNASPTLGTGTGTVTVKNSSFSYNNGGDGLNIRTAGTILLTDVTAEGNNGDGANLDNCLYGLYGATGACKNSSADYVTLAGTNIFADNQNDGLDVVTRGAITISNLIANGNATGWGALLNNTYATTALGVIFTGSNQLKYNNGGLYILSDGAITLNNINASGNTGNNGAILQNVTSTVGSVVTLTGTNIFNDNWNTGLAVNSKGVITLYNVTADGNGTSGTTGYGALLDNCLLVKPSGDPNTWYCGNSGVRSVLLNGASSFNGNFDTGLDITTRGAVTLNKITASNNIRPNASGVTIHNVYLLPTPPLTLPTAPQNVTILGYLTANDNGYRGLDLWSLGTITLYNVTTNNNNENGAHVDNCTWTGIACKAATVKNVLLYGNNTFNGNSGNGLNVLSKGAITLNNVIANDNEGLYGVYLENNSLGAVGGVTLTNLATFSPSISSNDFTGLAVYSRGTITIKDLDAIGNGLGGVELDNTYNTSTVVSSVTVGTLRLNWINNFDENGGTGLTINTKGVVTLYNLSGSNNTLGNGLYVYNVDAGAVTPRNVTLNGASWFDGNIAGEGMKIETEGLVTLNKISASGNGENGAVIQVSDTVLLPQNVLLNGYGWFNDNGDDGLNVLAYGLITLNNVIANGNGTDAGSFGWGVHLDNFRPGVTGTTLAKGVTLNGTNIFNDNYQDGLWVESLGIIRANNLSADGNQLNGVSLNNQVGLQNQTVVLTGTSFFTNNGDRLVAGDGFGLKVFSNGAITLNNINANGNGLGGAFLDNRGVIATIPATVTLTGTNNFMNNGDGNPAVNTEHGLVVWSDGNITINNLNANGNDGRGAQLNNQTYALATTPFIKLTGINNFLNNADGQWGLHVYAAGLVDITKITADGNGNGMYINADGNVTVTCGSMTGNTIAGWQIDALGSVITLKGVFAYGNGGANTSASSTPVYVRACPLP